MPGQVGAGRRTLRTEITRARLTRVLSSIPDGGVGVVVAPAGSGKTVLLRQWAGPLSASWLDLTPSYDDAALLAQQLVAVLHTRDGAFDPTIAELVPAGSRRLGAPFIRALSAQLEAASVKVILVLDDVDALTDTKVIEDFGELLLRLPDNARMVLACRWDPALHLGRLRLDGRVVEIRSSDLAFNLEEAVDLLEHGAGRRVTHGQARALVERTEGWAAGLQLAALSMQTAPDVDAFVDGFTGSDRLVADYLTSEVLSAQTPDVRRFLLRTSTLEWLSPRLCDAVTGDRNGWSMLHMLVERGLFVSHAGADRFRYHRLFGDLLCYQLRAEHAATEADCRRRAAGWLLDHGELDTAFGQLVAAGDVHGAVEALATDVDHDYCAHGAAGTVASLLKTVDAAPGSDKRTVPAVDGAATGSIETLAGFAAGLVALFPGRAVADPSEARDFRPTWRIATLGALAVSHASAGRLNAAERVAATALRIAREFDAVDDASVALARLALGITGLDRLELGAAEMQFAAACRGGGGERMAFDDLNRIHRARYVAIAEGIPAALALLRGASHHSSAWPAYLPARVSLEAQLLTRAAAVHDARALLQGPNGVSLAARIDVLVASDEIEGAREALDRWQPAPDDLRSHLERDLRRAVVLQREGHPGPAEVEIADAAARAEPEGLLAPFVEAPLAWSLLRSSARARRRGALRPLIERTRVGGGHPAVNAKLVEQLTLREATVLDYLPSRLNNGEIADSLFISVNTLKTHLRNIYRKLEVSNRDAAVAHAIDIGLL